MITKRYTALLGITTLIIGVSMVLFMGYGHPQAAVQGSFYALPQSGHFTQATGEGLDTLHKNLVMVKQAEVNVLQQKMMEQAPTLSRDQRLERIAATRADIERWEQANDIPPSTIKFMQPIAEEQ